MTRRIHSDTEPRSDVALPQPGDVLGGKYRIERELGSGGMGVVYEVTHVVMTRTRFAVKWLIPVADGGESARRFRREARLCGSIRHPHVVEVYDVTLDEGGSYMVMELLTGETLAARISRGGALSPSLACSMIVQCLSGVAAAHAAGVIHRDIKPANIFLCTPGMDGCVRPKVLDFGVSHVLSVTEALDTTRTRGSTAGTPAYMAPEQLRGEECDPRSDVYSMGVTLYEALIGDRAFRAGSQAELVVKILTGDVQVVSKRARALPPGLADVVTRAMHLEPQRRYATALEFAEALSPFVQLVAAGPASEAPASEPQSPQRSRQLATVGVLVLACGLLWFAPAVHRTDPQPETRTNAVVQIPSHTLGAMDAATGDSLATSVARPVEADARRDAGPLSTELPKPTAPKRVKQVHQHAVRPDVSTESPSTPSAAAPAQSPVQAEPVPPPTEPPIGRRRPRPAVQLKSF